MASQDNTTAGILKSMEGAWGKSQKHFDSKFGGAKVPNGDYMAKLTKVFIKVSQQGNPMIAREFILTEGEHEGSVIRDNLMLGDDEEKLSWLRLFIDQCGYEAPEEISELPELLQTIEKDAIIFKIRTKLNDQYINVRILQTEGGEDVGSGASADLDNGNAGAEDNEDENMRLELVAFAGAQGLEDVKEDMTLEEVQAELKNYDFEEKDMTTEEVDLLEKAGLGEFIKRKAPAVAKGPAKRGAPAPAASAKGPTPGKGPAKKKK